MSGFAPQALPSTAIIRKSGPVRHGLPDRTRIDTFLRQVARLAHSAAAVGEASISTWARACNVFCVSSITAMQTQITRGWTVVSTDLKARKDARTDQLGGLAGPST